jgi:hypothetical protein
MFTHGGTTVNGVPSTACSPAATLTATDEPGSPAAAVYGPGKRQSNTKISPTVVFGLGSEASEWVKPKCSLSAGHDGVGAGLL